MHELSFTSSLVDRLLEVAELQQAREVLEVSLAIGRFTLLETEQVRFCFEAISKETILESSVLKIEEIDARVKCGDCKYAGIAKPSEGLAHTIFLPTIQCPACNGGNVEITHGNEISIRSIKLRR